MTATDKETYRGRLREYERREQMTIWVAGGVAALVTFVAVGALQDAPAVLKPIVLSAAIIAGVAIAFARVGFEWAATLIKRDIEDGKVQATDDLDNSHRNWPSGPERWWTVALIALAFGWLVIVIGIWWHLIVCAIRSMTNS